MLTPKQSTFARLPGPGNRIRFIPGGFSLVEVTLAIGVVGFAFVALLGLLPVGMQTFRQAVDTSVRSQIVQRVFNEALQTNFETLVSVPSSDLYFDDQGNEVPRTESIYHVNVQIFPQTDLPTPASGGTNGANTNLATIRIKIANNPAHVADPFAPNAKLPWSETSMFVARNQ